MSLKWILRSTIKVLPLAYMGGIWYLSARPNDAVVNMGSYDSWIKEALHLVEFGLLYGFWVLAFLSEGRLTRGRNRLAAGLAVAYGGIDELHQLLVPSRSGNLIDFFKDILGVALLWYLLNRTYFSENADSRIGRSLRRLTSFLSPEVREQGTAEQR